MILTNRLFKREAPSRIAKSIFIFCEGAKREFQYFSYFKGIDSRINVQVYKLTPEENNSPLGLLEITKNCIIGNKEVSPKFNFIEGDEVWIVLDTDKDKVDSRAEQILTVRKECSDSKNWFVVQSNPCFEVWLYYHLNDLKLAADTIDETCKSWKNHVNNLGGFDSRRHPIYLERAILNAETNCNISDNKELDLGTTEVYLLGKSIFTLVENKINKVLKNV